MTLTDLAFSHQFTTVYTVERLTNLGALAEYPLSTMYSSTNDVPDSADILDAVCLFSYRSRFDVMLNKTLAVYFP